MIKNKLFDILYEHVKRKYPKENEDGVLENMCLMLDSIHDFIGERTELTPKDKELMIKTIFKVDDSKEDNFIYESLKNLRAGDFENELFLWILHSKKNNDLDMIKKVLFGDIISIAEQTKKDNLSSLFTIDAFNKSFEAYRKTLYYLSSDIKEEDILENTNKNINKFLFRIKIIELYNTLRDAIKNDKKNDTYRKEGEWQYVIHILRNYIMNYDDFKTLELKETNNDSQDLEDNIVSFFNSFKNHYKGIQNREYYIDIDKLEKSINDILKNIKIERLTIDDFFVKDITLLLELFLDKIKDEKTETKTRTNIVNMYDDPLDRYKNKSQGEEDVIIKALEDAGKTQIETIINDVSGYIQFVAIPPQLFDANESTGGENMKILGTKTIITMIPQPNSFDFKLLEDDCSLGYDGSRNYIFDISNDNYPIKTIIVSEDFIVSGYKSGWEILLDKYAYKKLEKKLVCGSCPGVTDLFELYKYFTTGKSEDDKKDVLNNIFQIKRAGDYSQIKFCQEYNDKQEINANKLLFLSNDRMSSSFCLLLKVPFVAPVYSGVMGSETFCVYYNPYADRTRLYEENRMPITKEDIKELVIKLKILRVDCERMKTCDLQNINDYIKKLEELEKDSNKYTLLSTLLVTQEIYDNNKYIFEKQIERNLAACVLYGMRIGDCLIDSPARFFNEDQQIEYNVLYKQLNKLYYYIQSLSIDESKDLERYKKLYDNIKEDIKDFLDKKSTNGLSLTYTPQKPNKKNIPSTPGTPIAMGLLSLSKDEDMSFPIIYEDDTDEEKSQNLFEYDTSSIKIKYAYNPLMKDISLKKYKDYNTVMFYNEKGYLLVQDFNPSAVIKINSIQKSKEQIYPDGTKITFKLN